VLLERELHHATGESKGAVSASESRERVMFPAYDAQQGVGAHGHGGQFFVAWLRSTATNAARLLSSPRTGLICTRPLEAEDKIPSRAPYDHTKVRSHRGRSHAGLGGNPRCDGSCDSMSEVIGNLAGRCRNGAGPFALRCHRAGVRPRARAERRRQDIGSGLRRRKSS